MSEFDGLGLNPGLLKVLAEVGYEAPTPIQAQTIPLVLQGKDVIGCARTGTGKTAAFALALLNRFTEPASRPQALILAPTRELACQIEASFQRYSKHSRVRIAVLYGGVGLQPQIQSLRRGVDIIVATPGRLMDHLERRTVDLSGVQVLVLDEADRMLDMGFEPQVRSIVRSVPKDRQTLLFSATVPPAIMGLARSYMRSPEHVEAERSGTTVDTVEQRVHMVAPAQKAELLDCLLKHEDPDSALIFTRTKRGADNLSRLLRKKGHRAECIHGDLAQAQRERIIEGFRRKRTRLLVATDVAARGLDVPHITHVINYDIPENAEDYVHRIGRTARAQRSGIAITLASAMDEPAIAGIERLVDQKIRREQLDGFEYEFDTSHITAAAHGRGGRGGGGGGRGGNGGGGRNRSDAILAFLETRYGATSRAAQR